MKEEWSYYCRKRERWKSWVSATKKKNISFRSSDPRLNCSPMCQLMGGCQYAVMLRSSHFLFCNLMLSVGQKHAWKLYERAWPTLRSFTHLSQVDCCLPHFLIQTPLQKQMLSASYIASGISNTMEFKQGFSNKIFLSSSSS